MEYCAVIGPPLHSARQQTPVKEVTRPFLSLAERGVANARLLLDHTKVVVLTLSLPPSLCEGPARLSYSSIPN